MSHMANRDHIAITSGDASTTRCMVSVLVCPVTPPITVTQGESSDTYRRIAADSGILSGKYSAGGARGTQFASSYTANVCHLLSARMSESRRRGRAAEAASAARWATVRFTGCRDRLVDADIRGVSHHYRIVTYQTTTKAGVKVTRLSLLSVTSQYGAHRIFP